MTDNKKSVIKIDVEPIGKRIVLEGKKNGLDALIDAGIEIKSVCAGQGTCGKCRILIMDEAAPKPNERELKALSAEEIKHGMRLACQQVFDKDMKIYIPASSLTEEQKLQVTGAEADIAVDRICKKYFVKLSAPTLSDMESDYSRIKRAISSFFNEKIESIDFKVLNEMPSVLRKNGWQVTVTVRNNEIILIEGGDKSASSYGIAIDLGTTKIATLLVDLNTAKTVNKKGAMNPQISFGEDVMSRINYAMQGPENSEKIQKVLVNQINKTIQELASESGISVNEIVEITIVGNTAMHHLLLGLPVRQLGLSPFVALTDKPLDMKAREIGLKISAGAYLYLMPVIAGFVGSDHLAMILASDIFDRKGNIIGIDIGTNTEIVLKTEKSIESVSTASGPAFEGAHIKHGMRAAPGAIERVIIDSQTCIPKIQTIGDKKPTGICGSGILDAIAELLKAGIINNRGKFQPESGCLCIDDKGALQYILEPAFHKERIKCQAEKENEASSANEAESSHKDTASANNGKNNASSLCPCLDGNVSINQNDIVEIQLAKSALRTGIEILMESAAIEFKDLDKIIVAGAFGSYIDPKNVVEIGMFPAVMLEKISQVGNAAAVGAKMVLVSGFLRKKAEDI
ncbi:MAG: DUF4445 domain-containing protein, partial [Actinobacteria bacterium]|nr:DUF4445 domain-containing protein [Actinomycetota bacterium]